MLLLLLRLLRLLLLWLPRCCCGLLPCCCGLRRHLRELLGLILGTGGLCGLLALLLVLRARASAALAVRALAACCPCCCDRFATSESSLVQVVLVGSLAPSVGGASSKSVVSLMLVRACAAFLRAVLCAALRVSPRRPPQRRVRFCWVPSSCASGARSSEALAGELEASSSVAAQEMLEVAEELACKSLDGQHEVVEDGCDVVHRAGLLNTAKGWSDLLNVLLGSQLDAVRRSGLL